MAFMHSEPAPVTRPPRRSALKQKTLVDTIYQEIRGRLTRGEIGDEDRLLDYQIADEFECTRMPARQALLRLVTESFLVGTTRGFVVPRWEEADVREIFEVRRMLEPPAAAKVSRVLGDADLASLRSSYEEARAATSRGDVPGAAKGNIAFRSTWLQRVENRRLRSTIQTFAEHVQQVRLQTLHHPAALHDALECLRSLLEAFDQRDPQRAEQAMNALLVRAEQHYFAAHSPERPAPVCTKHSPCEDPP